MECSDKAAAPAQTAEDLQAILAHTNLLVVRVDLEGRFTFVNDAYCRLFGRTHDQLIGSQYMPLVHEDDRDATRRAVERLMTPPHECSVEQRAMTVLGWRWLTWHDRGILDAQGKLVGIVAVGLDVTDTEHRQFENLVHQREKNFRAFFDLVPDMLFILDADGVILDANQSAHDRLGYDPGQLGGVNVLDLHAPSQREQASSTVSAMIGGSRAVCTLPLHGKNGIRIPVETRVTPGVWNESPALFGVSRDLSMQIAAHAETEHLADFGRILVQLSADLVNLPLPQMDEAVNRALATVGAFCGVDRSYLFQFGPNEEWMDNTHEWCADGISAEMANLQHIPTAALPAWMHKLRLPENIVIEDVSKLGDEWNAEREILQSQGIQSLLVVPLLCQNHLLGFAGFDSVRKPRLYTSEEITLLRLMGDLLAGLLHRRRMEEDLRRQTVLLSGLLDSIPDIVFFKDGQGVYLGANREFKRLTGREQAGVVGRTDYDLFDAKSADFFREQDRLMMQGQTPRHNEEWVAYPDGKRILIDTYKAPLRDSDGQLVGMLGVSRDITERKRLENELRESNEKLERAVTELRTARDAAEKASRIKSDFVANISHEIRTPLNAILGYAQILQRTEDPRFAQAEGLRVIRQSGEHLLSMLNDVLSLSKLDAEQVRISQDVFSLRELLAELMRMFGLRARERSLRFELDYPAGLSDLVLGDEVKIRQVLVNLFSNAVRFTSRGAISVHVTATSRGRDTTAWQIEVQDTGCGMSEADLGRIFQPFTQGAGGQKSGGGTGLGLTISRRLARAMGGDLSVESREGAGSTFRFDFVAGIPAGDAMPRVRLQGKVEGLAAGSPRTKLLIVDDHQQNRQMLSAMLSLVGFVVQEAEGGEPAITALRTWRPDAILMDKRMPGMDGITAMQRIREDPATADIPVIIVTASDMARAPSDLRALGAAGFIGKPLREEQLYEELARVLGVSYQYTSSAPADVPSAAETTVQARDLAALAPADRVAIRKAVLRGDARHLRDLADALTTRGAAVGRPLRALIDRYEYELLIRLMDEAEGGKHP